ncbi:MAG: DUF2341 domain-containing protein [Flavobacteriales bacterium]|nr:DUF2341 domain-containing protein [Flavobacteriales bacterium]
MRLVITLLMIVAVSFSSIAQPCLTGWTYRLPIEIDNTNNASTLTDYQVSVTVNTAELVTAGKMSAAGDDIRFLNENGDELNHYVQEGTFDSEFTEIWINVDQLPASATTSIYMYYGSPSAANTANEEATFEFFDGFDIDGADVSNKWTSESSGGQLTVANSSLLIEATGGPDITTITSVATFNEPVISEMNVTVVSTTGDEIFYIGQVNAAGNGFAGVYIDNGTSSMNVKIIDTGTPQTLSNVLNGNSESASDVICEWEFAWPLYDEQFFTWDNSGGAESITDQEDIIYTTPFNTTLGVESSTASALTIGWYRVRKYTDVEPFALPQTEVLILVPSVNVTSNSPVCEGTDILLTAPEIADLSYAWTGPNLFSDNTFNPTIFTSDSLTHAGMYNLQIVDPGGCEVKTYNIWVDIQLSATAGSIAQRDTVCYGINSDTIVIAGYTGSILRWEFTTTGGAPWSTIANTADTLFYNNLIQSTDYRAVLNNGNCTEVITDTAYVVVDATTVKGNMFGSTSICGDANSGEVKLLNYVGNISYWESSADEGTTWTMIADTANTQTYANLTDTTWYRAELQSGVCAAVISDTAILNILAVPVPAFTATTECEGNTTVFTNTSSIPTGTIALNSWDFKDGNSSSAQNPSNLFAISADYLVKLTTTSNNGCIDSITSLITVNPSPTADFIFEGVCEMSNTAFTNLSSIAGGSITGYAWDFADGEVDLISASPNHTYATDSIHNVQLIVVSDLACLDSITKEVQIYDLPVMAFVSDSVCLGNAINFENNTTSSSSVINFEWSFGDSETSFLKHPAHTYSNYGTYSVLLNATTNEGCTSSIKDTVLIHANPVVAFSVADHCMGDTAVFSNGSSVAIGSQSYDWNFGDANTSISANPEHYYEAASFYSIELTATTEFDCVASTSQSVKVNPLPVPNFVFDNACENAATEITNLSSIASGVMSYVWDYGDNSTFDTSTNASHTYTEQGSYFITLHVTSESNCVDSITNEVVVYDNPIASFTVADVCDGYESEFVNVSTIETGSIVSTTWDFGDGNNSIVNSPAHQFFNIGDYEVNLQVVSNNGCADDTTISTTVQEIPVANFSAEGVCFETATSFINKSSIANGTLTYYWDLGNGTDISAALNPELEYALPGVYAVKLIATSNIGCIDSVSNGIVVFSIPVVDAGIDTAMSMGETINLYATGGENFIWTPASTLDNSLAQSPETFTEESQLYTVVVTDEFGCQNQDDVMVTVRDDFNVTVSNVLTPNGNGENDYWVVENLASYSNNVVTVYNRLGKPVFHQENYQNDWEGLSGTDILPDGTYYYLITFSDTDVEYKGAITLLRNK